MVNSVVWPQHLLLHLIHPRASTPSPSPKERKVDEEGEGEKKKGGDKVASLSVCKGKDSGHYRMGHPILANPKNLKHFFSWNEIRERKKTRRKKTTNKIKKESRPHLCVWSLATFKRRLYQRTIVGPCWGEPCVRDSGIVCSNSSAARLHWWIRCTRAEASKGSLD